MHRATHLTYACFISAAEQHFSLIFLSLYGRTAASLVVVILTCVIIFTKNVLFNVSNNNHDNRLLPLQQCYVKFQNNTPPYLFILHINKYEFSQYTWIITLYHICTTLNKWLCINKKLYCVHFCNVSSVLKLLSILGCNVNATGYINSCNLVNLIFLYSFSFPSHVNIYPPVFSFILHFSGFSHRSAPSPNCLSHPTCASCSSGLTTSTPCISPKWKRYPIHSIFTFAKFKNICYLT